MSADWVEAERDELAVAEADQRLAGGASYELWDRNRLVVRNSSARR